MSDIIDIIRHNPLAFLADLFAMLLMGVMLYGLLLISPALEQTIIEAKGSAERLRPTQSEDANNWEGAYESQ